MEIKRLPTKKEIGFDIQVENTMHLALTFTEMSITTCKSFCFERKKNLLNWI